MKKKCPCCGTELIGAMELKMNDAPFANAILHAKGKNIRIEAWLCPDCGKVELYAKSTSPR